MVLQEQYMKLPSVMQQRCVNDKLTGNDHTTLQVPSALQSILVAFHCKM